jgi:enoyl-CoA hydratase/carnithine racemase
MASAAALAAGCGRQGESMAWSTLIVTDHGQIDEVVLNRPERLNTLGSQLTADLFDYFQGLPRRRSTRVVVLRGAGRAFCAGADLNETASGTPADKLQAMWKVQETLGQIVLMMNRCPQPVIALVQGAAAGGGMALALAADVRIGTPNCRMIPSFIKIGLSACDIGISYFLPRLVGRSVAAEIMMAGRTLQAERALRIGLVSELVPEEGLVDAGLALAREMLNASPFGLRMTKEVLNINQDAQSLEAALALENRTQVLCGQTDDLQEGVAAFLEKRPPQYTGR